MSQATTHMSERKKRNNAIAEAVLTIVSIPVLAATMAAGVMAAYNTPAIVNWIAQDPPRNEIQGTDQAAAIKATFKQYGVETTNPATTVIEPKRRPLSEYIKEYNNSTSTSYTRGYGSR